MNNSTAANTPSTMTAILVHAFGDTEAMSLEQVALPEIQDDEVLVKVMAAGVGPWDGWIRSGNSVLPQPLPLTLGSDIAGVVVAVGSKATQWQVGEDVYGVTNKRFTGGYAEYAACLASMIAHKPVSLSYVEAAAVPVVAVTAAQMLFDAADLHSGDTVLIHGAAGNVGRYAVQLAHAAGLKVVATSSDADAAAVTALGADQVIGRTLQPVTVVDAVIDLVGGPTQPQLFDFLKAGGKFISAVAEPDQAVAQARGVSARFMLVDVNTEALTRLNHQFDNGSLFPWVGSVLKLADARVAHEMMEGRADHIPGKIVLEVATADSSDKT
ncbi:NADP-dependent oxidoreductase [Massilia sp. 2TAF26]|uniref:NADP-dependent oxidoreductase n=1 Tax=Massilia sp. 2TAF26 TaxID=3233012 RepID=UPI003F97F30A